MKIELRELEVEARNLGPAIAQHGTHRSPTLLTHLSLVENRIEAIESQLQGPKVEVPEVSIERIREFALSQAKNLEATLRTGSHHR
jgi:hypothetical protein